MEARLKLLQGREVCRKVRQAPCTILWNRTLNDMVRLGFGSAIAYTVGAVNYGELAGCDNAVSQSFMRDWTSWGMGPFWSKVLHDDEFNSRWKISGRCDFVPKVDAVLGVPLYMRCHGKTSLAYEDFKTRSPFKCRLYDEFELFLHQMVQVFGPVLYRYAPAFEHSYAALHVRHGDKIMEDRPIYGLREHFRGVHKLWPSMHRMFVTSDDAKVIHAARQENVDATVRWTADEKRWSGGAPSGQFMNHEHSTSAVSAVLSDFTALALSRALVGNNGSCFFNSARVLNMALSWKQRRAQPWCYDVHTRAICDYWWFVYWDWGPGILGGH